MDTSRTLNKVDFRCLMKIKLWQWEYDFDKQDAKIVVPLILLLLGLAFTQLNKAALWIGASTYYLLYFFLEPCFLGLKGMFARFRAWLSFRCPYCKSREVILQGYQGYHSDELYAFHLCNECRKTSVLVNGKLIKATRVSATAELESVIKTKGQRD